MDGEARFKGHSKKHRLLRTKKKTENSGETWSPDVLM